MTYRRALSNLEDRQETRIRLGLGRIRRHLAALGGPQEAYRSIHVAGTNGKGSVGAMLASVLRESGQRTGLYTSPHLHDVRERILVDGRRIPPEAFARAAERILSLERRRPSDRLTFFEFLTSVAFQYFREAGVRVAVLETGLGGRFDATNVVRRPLATLVSAIDFDHMDWLGRSLAAIAREKAGIFKRGVRALTAEPKPEPLAALRAAARVRGAPFAALPREAGWRSARVDWRRGRQTLRGPGGRELELGLLGGAQVRNAALVLEALKALRAGGIAVPWSAVERGLAGVRWPGRFEAARRRGRMIILDGAHNVQAMSAFRETLEASPWRRSPKHFVVGVLRDKEHEKMVRVLAPLLRGRRVTAATPSSPRALDAGDLAREIRRWAPEARVSAEPDLARALDSRAGELLCVCGSFYLVGAARRLLGLGEL